MCEAVTIYAARGCYFPAIKLSIEKFVAQGFSQRFMLEYIGQVDQLYSPNPEGGATPHPAMPEQLTNSSVSGRPGPCSRNLVDQVTLFFATGQSNVLSNIGPSARDRRCIRSTLESTASAVRQSSRVVRNKLDGEAARLTVHEAFPACTF
jgi:hypothetical protein